MKEKVKVTKEVAEALENRLVYDNPADIVATSARNGWEERGIKNNGCLNKRYLDLDTLIRAVYFGYEVEKTEKEKVIDHFKSHIEISKCYNAKKKGTLDICEIEQERYSSGFVAGITEFARAYEIKLSMND